MLMFRVLANLFRKSSTIEYPKKRTEIENDARGRHYVDLSKCIGCSLCALECPSKAITMKKIPDEIKPPQNRRGLIPIIDYRSCIFCYRCVKVCPVNAYIVTNVYDMSTESVSTSEELSMQTLRR